jgi:hypothetical protein
MANAKPKKDWIPKHEEEDRDRKVSEQREEELQEQIIRNSRTRFQTICQKILPFLIERVEQVKQRLNVPLQLGVGETELTVSLGKEGPQPKYLFSVAHYWNSPLQLQVRENSYIRFQDGGDWHLKSERLVDVSTEIDDLLSGDLDKLIQWLVARSGGRDGSEYLELECVRRQRDREKAATRRLRNNSRLAALLVLVGILSLGLPLGPIALFGGVAMKSRLKKIGQQDGQTACDWAIGLGALGSFALAIALYAFIRNAFFR